VTDTLIIVDVRESFRSRNSRRAILPVLPVLG
jgi:hypothetical protein